ncbi:hypothetical protein [Anaeromyxobacter dehalogenans]|nr:hypothetical protein [Anaeromyxobacter dehalogenans]
MNRSTANGLRALTALGLAAALTACGGSGADGPDAQLPGVTVTPAAVEVAPGEPVGFAATVTGSANVAVTWAVQETGGGTIDGSGNYTAPASTGTFHVVATSAADPSKSGSATVTVATAPPPGGGGGGAGVISADRITDWRPGILADDQLGLPLGADRLPQRTTVCATLSPGANIQAAIDACPAGQVVQLNAGTFTVSATVTLTKGVVLRGAGYQGAPAGTTIVKTGGGTAIAIGTGRDSTCYGGTAYGLTRDAAKGSTTLSVGSAAANFAPGDLALVDVADDSTVHQGDCSYYKRVSGRSASQRVEVKAVDAAAGTLTLTTPLHWTFRATSPYVAQVTRAPRTTVKWAGVEHLRIQGGTNTGYNGQMAGGIDISNAAYCWVKDVQTDGTVGGMHVALTGAYRCVVRDSYLHHSANYGFGADCYGIVLRCGTADNLVENNIVRWMNKPILFNASGGGNVIGYNYADNSWSSPAAYQEVNIDSHCAFPHMELMEGNYAPHMGASTTHGNAGYLTYFRNYASSVFAPPAVYGSTATQWQNVASLQFDGGDIGMNAVGNVLGTAGVSTTYEGYNINLYNVFQLGANGAGASDVATTTLYRHGNFDTVNNATVWDPARTDRTLPASLYLTARPGWWPAGTPWPWTGPDLSPMIGTLPAKARSDANP